MSTRWIRRAWPAVFVVFGACASVEPQVQEPAQGQVTGRAEASAGSPIVVSPQINPPRASRGNPPEYEVMGRRYRVMDTGDNYRDTGVASWYGRKFHGRPTSSGERYDMFAMTAAHKTLPIPMWVEVTNQRNGRSVIVKVNDRGPFVDDRIIDLSYAAALELDMVEAGTAPVFVRALGASAAPSTAGSMASLTPATTESRQVFVQVGAYSDQSNARRMVDRLQGSGFDNASIFSDDFGTGVVHRVRIGPLNSDALFASVRDELSQLGFEGVRMIVEFVRD